MFGFTIYAHMRKSLNTLIKFQGSRMELFKFAEHRLQSSTLAETAATIYIYMFSVRFLIKGSCYFQ